MSFSAFKRLYTLSTASSLPIMKVIIGLPGPRLNDSFSSSSWTNNSRLFCLHAARSLMASRLHAVFGIIAEYVIHAHVAQPLNGWHVVDRPHTDLEAAPVPVVHDLGVHGALVGHEEADVQPLRLSQQRLGIGFRAGLQRKTEGCGRVGRPDLPKRRGIE